MGPLLQPSAADPAETQGIAPFVRSDWSSLGTDGFGRSDTRAALPRAAIRRYGLVDGTPSVATSGGRDAPLDTPYRAARRPLPPEL